LDIIKEGVLSTHREFSNSNNPDFECQKSVLMLPFGRNSYLPAIIQRFDSDTVPVDETTDREVYTIHNSSIIITVIFSGMGSPAIVNALEMVKNNGAERVVLFGACGGTSGNIQVGDLIIPKGAVRGEGASRYYAPIEFPAAFDVELTYQLIKEANRREVVPVHHGFIYTTDASYRQGAEIYETYKNIIIGADCECSAAAVAGAVMQLKVAALFFCTDNTTLPKKDDQKYKGLRDKKVQRGFETGLDIVVQVLSQSTIVT
jgi:uridine phosphorylase